MKIKAIIAAAAVIILSATSCAILGSTNQVAANNEQSGSSVGGALASLYGQYKTDGKIDLTNINNILNIATIANNINILKGNAATSSSLVEEFTNGLISGSKSLVNKNNSAKVVDNLIKLSGVNLNSITNAASTISASSIEKANAAASKINSASNQVTSAVSTLNSIFSLLK